MVGIPCSVMEVGELRRLAFSILLHATDL